MIADGSDDGTVKLWKLDGTLIATLTEHKKGINGTTFSPDSKIVASASVDKTIKLWKRDGTPITTLTGHSDTVTNVTFSPDGILASASSDGKVILWSLNLDNLLTQGCQWLQDYFVTHPDALKRLKVCRKYSSFNPPYSF